MIGSSPIASAPIAAFLSEGIFADCLDTAAGSDTITTTETYLISEVVNINDPFIFKAVLAVLEALEVSGTLTYQEVFLLLDGMGVDDSFVHTATQNIDISDSLTIRDALRIVLQGVVSEDIAVSDAESIVAWMFSLISDSADINDTRSTQIIGNHVLSEAIQISDILGKVFAELISEDVNITLIDLVALYIAISDSLAASDSSSEFISLFVVASDELEVSESLDNQASLNQSIMDAIKFIIFSQPGESTYSGWVLNPEVFAVSNYTNYNFNSITFFDNKYLATNSNGLFELDGKMDESSYILAKIKTAALDFGTSNKKQVPSLYLGATNDGPLVLKVLLDGKSTSYYELTPSTSGLDTQKVSIGKGLIGRYWQFELITKNNINFDLDTLELFPIVFGRKI